ncbi:unnamed protein product [Nippostrongylus brasiliensis]|uniref:EF-hand domain-containing protein n=1 Tax=Nippostrongylus brasiliensis TaxID=27835 RepID=A0A0N4XK55_NIPBR|nr:unnamed protein product [Nippostrongylus brasiliensis]
MALGPCTASCGLGYACSADVFNSQCCPVVDYTNPQNILGPSMGGLCPVGYVVVYTTPEVPGVCSPDKQVGLCTSSVCPAGFTCNQYAAIDFSHLYRFQTEFFTCEQIDEQPMNFAAFLEIAKEEHNSGDELTEIIKALKGFDRNGSRSIPAKELRSILTSIGERMSHQEVDLVLERVCRLSYRFQPWLLILFTFLFIIIILYVGLGSTFDKFRSIC